MFCLFVLFFGYSQQWTCRALALGGGADRGAYEAGALKALVEKQNPEHVKWNVIAGISAGALNAGALAQFKLGNEIQASKFLEDRWKEIKFGDILSHWIPGSILQGFLFKSGLFDSTPLGKFIDKNLNFTMLRNSNRALRIGVTNLNTGLFESFEETHPNLRTAVLSSCSVPGIFPTQEMNGNDYVDGGAWSMTPIKSALKVCEEKNATEIYVDVILALGDTEYPGFLDRLLMTPFILLKTLFGLVNNVFVKDIENARIAFPNAKIRVIKPTQWLPGWFLGFGHTKEMMEIGYKDALRAINEVSF